MGVRLNWAVGELGRSVRISHKTTVGEVGVSLIWSYGELGRPARSRPKTTDGKWE